MNAERQRILQRLIHAPGLSFNQLWNKEGASNKFAYHLKVLEEDGLVEKRETEDGASYSLTHEGKKYVTYVSGATGEKEKAPLVGVLVAVIDRGRTLMMERMKEPFYGCWGFVGGKLKFDQYVLECAKAELKEETGLECDLELKGLFSSKTFNNGALSYSHQMFVIKATNPRGELIPETREGKNAWIPLDKIPGKIFPNVPLTLKIVQSKGFRIVEADRHQENDAFTGIDVLRDEEL